MKSTWRRYHLIRDCLRGNLTDNVNNDFTENLKHELQNEPIIYTPKITKQFKREPIIGFAIAIGMTTLSFVVGDRKPDNEKLSAYECGFEAFDDARGRFDVRFYLVAILFIIFDLEVAFLFPWAVSLGSIGIFGFWSMMIFLLILTIGFIYEWKKGALEWE